MKKKLRKLLLQALQILEEKELSIDDLEEMTTEEDLTLILENENEKGVMTEDSIFREETKGSSVLSSSLNINKVTLI